MIQPAILSFGEVLWDLFPGGAKFGGAPANFACHAARLGAEISILSAVGPDVRGGEALAVLQHHRVNTSLVQRCAQAPTGAVTVTLDTAGKPAFRIEPDSAWDRIVTTPDLKTAVSGAGAVYFGTLGQRGATSRATLRYVLELAEAKGALRVLDVNLRRPFYSAPLIAESIQRASVLKLSAEELAEVATACGLKFQGQPENTLRELRAKCRLALVAMTLGADGAMLVSATEIVRQPGIPVVVRDTVGAGDAFTAALTVGLLRGEPLAQAARRACELAAVVCAHDGAVPEPPSEERK